MTGVGAKPRSDFACDQAMGHWLCQALDDDRSGTQGPRGLGVGL